MNPPFIPGSGIADVLSKATSGQQQQYEHDNEVSEFSVRPPVFNTEFHVDERGMDAPASSTSGRGEPTSTSSSFTTGGRLGLVSKWRPKERLKTTAVALVVCLNIGK